MHECVVCGAAISGGYFLRKFRFWRLSTCTTEHSMLLDERLKPLKGVKPIDPDALDVVCRGEAEVIPASLKTRAMLKFFGPMLDG